MDQLNRRILACNACPRLREHCQRMAEVRRAAYRDWTYHGKPVPNFGDPDASILVVGLAPAAHGANRTGRMFTGDRSGDFLYRAMHAAGLASQPTATHADDGLTLRGAMITAAAHCAPPDNKPTPAEFANCAPFLDQTFDLLLPPRGNLRVVVCLGKLALDAVARFYKQRGWIERVGALRFGHGVEHLVESEVGAKPQAAIGAPAIICSYHPSQQNTFTGRLTDAMLLDVFRRAVELAAHR